MHAKSRLLFVSPEPAWLGRLGAHQRMLAIIDLLATRYEVIKFSIGKDFGKMGTPGDWTVVDQPLGTTLGNTQFQHSFIDFVRKNAIDVVYFNYFTFALLARMLPDGVIRVCDIHDVQHLRAASFSAVGEEAPKKADKETELEALEAFDLLVSINSNETRYLEDHIQTPVITIPHIARFKELSFKEQRYPISVGSYAKANRDGFRQLLLPAVKNDHITSLVLLAGGISALAMEDRTGRIIPMGPFNSPADIYPHASVALAPLRIGAGLKIKVVEALVHGVPVAGTACAFDGIPELPPEVFMQVESSEDFRGLDDFVSRSDYAKVREFAEANYAPEHYLELIDFR